MGTSAGIATFLTFSRAAFETDFLRPSSKLTTTIGLFPLLSNPTIVPNLPRVALDVPTTRSATSKFRSIFAKTLHTAHILSIQSRKVKKSQEMTHNLLYNTAESFVAQDLSYLVMLSKCSKCFRIYIFLPPKGLSTGSSYDEPVPRVNG